MTGFSKALSFLAGAAAMVAVSASDAYAALSYIGRDTSTSAASGTAISKWFTNAGAVKTTLTPTGVTGSGTGTMNIPLGFSTGVTTPAFASSQTPGASTLSTGTPGSLSGAPAGSVFVDSTTARSITITGFSPLATSFGFFLENANLGATAQTGTVTIVMTDSLGGVSAIQVTAAGVVTADNKSTSAGGAGLFNGANATDGSQNAQFVGFTGTTPISQIVISGTAGVRWELGSFYEGAVPEPASMVLLGAGLAGLGVLRRRKKA